MTIIAVQRGVYRHAIIGPFDSLVKAIDAAGDAALRDKDCYHHWEIVGLADGVEYPVGEVWPLDEAARGKATQKERILARCPWNPPSATEWAPGGTKDIWDGKNHLRGGD